MSEVEETEQLPPLPKAAKRASLEALRWQGLGVCHVKARFLVDFPVRLLCDLQHRQRHDAVCHVLYLRLRVRVGEECTRAASRWQQPSRTLSAGEGVKLPPSRDLCYTPSAAQLATWSRQRKTKSCHIFLFPFGICDWRAHVRDVDDAATAAAVATTAYYCTTDCRPDLMAPDALPPHASNIVALESPCPRLCFCVRRAVSADFDTGYEFRSYRAGCRRLAPASAARPPECAEFCWIPGKLAGQTAVRSGQFDASWPSSGEGYASDPSAPGAGRCTPGRQAACDIDM